MLSRRFSCSGLALQGATQGHRAFRTLCVPFRRINRKERPGRKGLHVSAGWVCQIGLNPLPKTDTRLLPAAGNLPREKNGIFSLNLVPRPARTHAPRRRRRHGGAAPPTSSPSRSLLLRVAQKGLDSCSELSEPTAEARSGSPRGKTSRTAELLTERVHQVGTACGKRIDRISRLKAVKYSRVKIKQYKKEAWLRQCSAETLAPSPALVSASPKHSSRGRASACQEKRQLLPRTSNAAARGVVEEEPLV